jgi:TM2 domain-containing membrane protein YozV
MAQTIGVLFTIAFFCAIGFGIVLIVRASSRNESGPTITPASAQIAMMQREMNPQQAMMVMQMVQNQQKNATTAVLLALFLGGLGAHKFYLGKVGLGILYIVFFWTFIPTFVALIECFLISGQVQRYNEALTMNAMIQVNAYRNA